MIGRKMFNSGTRLGVGCTLAMLLAGGVRCQGDPLYVGPIEIIGSVSTEPDSEDAGGGGSGVPPDAALPGDAATSDAGAAEPDAADASALACAIPANEPPALALPLVIDDYFAPSGWAGDAAAGGLQVPDCDRDREAGAAGNCHRFDYTPLPAAVPGSASWAGVFFQYPDGNWGARAGLPIEPGARRVSFLAAGATGGEIVTFRAGGIGDASGALACADEFSRDITVRLSDDFQRYEIDLAGAPYTHVISAFSWKISKVLFSGETPETISFYLDDLRWE
jgi:hypothetical protein